VADYNRDGKVDFYLTAFSDDYNALYHNDGNGNFSDVAYRAGLGTPTLPFLAWGTGFLDFDNDGLPDIFVANGHVYPTVDQQPWGITYAQRPQLFRNLNGVKFQEVPPATGSGLADLLTARGAAFGDLFNDGHIDVVLIIWILLQRCFATPSRMKITGSVSNWWAAQKLREMRLEQRFSSPQERSGSEEMCSAAGVTDPTPILVCISDWALAR